jgi:hypothetical protein
MIEATTLKDRFDGYSKAYSTAKHLAEEKFHPAWHYFHHVFTRRRNGDPLLPRDGNLLTSAPGAATAYLLDEDQQLAANQVQSILRTIMATTFNRSPEFSLDPEYEGFSAPRSAILATCALNRTWQTGKFTDAAREAYQDSLLYGRGWVKVGWQSTMTRPIAAGGTAGETLRDARDAVLEVSRRGTRLGHIPFDEERVKSHMAMFGGKLLLEDQPTVRRVSPFDMFFDPYALNVDDARWIAQRWRCPVGFAKNNQDWSKKNRESLSPTQVIEDALSPESDAHGASTDEYAGNDTVWIIDFFDLADGTWCQFAEGGEDYLRKPSPIPYPWGQPFVWIENIEDAESQFPISEVEVIWPHQRDLTAIMGEIGTDRVRSRAKLLVNEEDHEQLRPAIEGKEAGLVVPVKVDPGGNIETSFKFFKPDSNANSLAGQFAMISQEMVQASGVSDYMRAGGNAGETATEVNAKQVASANFMGEKASRVRDFLEQIAQRVLVELQVFSRLEFHVKTKAPEQQEDGSTSMVDAVIPYKKDHFQGSYRVIVSGDTMEQQTPQAKQARAQAIAATAMPFAQAGIVDLGKLFAYVMKDGFGIDDPTGLLTQQAFAPPEMAPPGAPPQDPTQSGAQAMGGVSMTPGSQAGQLGATAAQERFDQGASVPPPQ